MLHLKKLSTDFVNLLYVIKSVLYTMTRAPENGAHGTRWVRTKHIWSDKRKSQMMVDWTQLTADWTNSQEIGQTFQQMGKTILKMGQNIAQAII